MLAETRVEQPQLNDFGNKIRDLRMDAMRFLDLWKNKLVRGDLADAYLDTHDPNQRLRLERQHAACVISAGLAAGTAAPSERLLRLPAALDPELMNNLCLPDYYALFRRVGILSTNKLRAGDPGTQNLILTSIRSLFSSHPVDPGVGNFTIEPSSSTEPWKTDAAGAIQVPLDFIMSLPKGGPPQYNATGTMYVASSPGVMDGNRAARWRLINMELKRIEVRRTGLPGGTAVD
jgi:hypothetical protein